MRAITTQQLFDLTTKTALITGGSRGLGLQIATALGEQGARIVLVARTQSDLDVAQRDLQERGIDVSTIAADLRQEQAIFPLVQEVMARLGKIDVLVNNAGASYMAPAQEHTIAAWDKVMDLNIRSIFLLTQAVGKLSMIPNRYGKIINVASIAGLLGNVPGTMQMLAYNTSKGALVNFTRALAAEWGEHGITVNALAPGLFPSKLTQGVIDRLGVENMTQRVPLQRLGDDEDLKGAALLFASDASKHITGQILAIDGGASAVG